MGTAIPHTTVWRHRPVSRLIGRLVALVLVLVSMVALGPGAATAAPSAKVATLTVYADASALAENGWTAETLQSGHAFISVKNISTSPITVGGLTKVQPQQVVTVGTWGNREEHVGVWYNLESYYIHKNLRIIQN